MASARIFRNGRSQAVRIPKNLEFDTREVEIVRMGTGLALFPKTGKPWENVKAVASEPSRFPDYLPPAPDQERDLTW